MLKQHIILKKMHIFLKKLGKNHTKKTSMTMILTVIISLILSGFISPVSAYNETYTTSEPYEWIWEYEEHAYWKSNKVDSFVPNKPGSYWGSGNMTNPVQVKTKTVSTNYTRQQMIDMLKCDVAYYYGTGIYKTPSAGIPGYVYKAIPSSSVKLKETKYKNVQTTKWVNEKVTFKNEAGDILSTGTYDRYSAIKPPIDSIVKKEGYTLKEWFDEINNKSYALGSSVYADANNKNGRSLIPKYNANTYTITFDGNGNTEGAMTPQNMTYDHNEALATNKFKKTGYTFAGWENGNIIYKDEENVKNLTSQQGGNIILKAIWNINSYNVTFLDYDGKELKKEHVNYGSKATAPKGIKRKGYTFDKWDKDFNSVIEDMVITAQYLPNKYSVKYNTDGGNNIPDKIGVQWEDKKLLPDVVPVKAGFVFNGWKYNQKNITSENKYGDIANNDDNGTSITLKAIWNELKDYSITYNANGGKLPNGFSSHISNMTFNDKIKLPTPIKDGYSFDGWIYNDKKIEDETYGELTGDDTIKEITLTATWRINDRFEGKGSVKTNDETNILLWITLLFSSGVIILVSIDCIIKRER